MPYMSESTPYIVDMEQIKFNQENTINDWDTRGYLYIITTKGNRVEVNKYYCEKIIGYDNDIIENIDGQSELILTPKIKWVEITKEEFEERKKNKVND